MVTILQHPIATDFIYPFFLMFFIVFAILHKTKLLGEDRPSLNAWISLVISLIFVSAVFPKVVVGNLILFLVVGLVILFVGMLLWGFISGKGTIDNKGMKGFLTTVIIIALVLAVIGFTGIGGGLQGIFDFLFSSNWSGDFWTNFFFIAVIVGAVVIALGVKKKTG